MNHWLHSVGTNWKGNKTRNPTKPCNIEERQNIFVLGRLKTRRLRLLLIWGFLQFLISPPQTSHREQARTPNLVPLHQVCHLESTVCLLCSQLGEVKRIYDNKVFMDLPVSSDASENECVEIWNVPETGGKPFDERLLQKNCLDNKINYTVLNFARKSIFIKKPCRPVHHLIPWQKLPPFGESEHYLVQNVFAWRFLNVAMVKE